MTTRPKGDGASAATPTSGVGRLRRASTSLCHTEPADPLEASAPSASPAGVSSFAGLAVLAKLLAVAVSVSVGGNIAPVAATLVGVLVVGPMAAHLVAWWIGWRVVVPLFVGYVPPAGAVRGTSATCVQCYRPLSPGRLPTPAITWAWTVASRCRWCGARLPAWVSAVAWSMAALFALATARFGVSWRLWLVLAFSAGAVAICAVDVQCRRIPTLVVWPSMAICGGLAAVGSIALDQPAATAGAAVGAVTAGGLLLVLHLLAPAGLGMGDVRFGSLVGLVAGWAGSTPGNAVAGPVGAALAAVFVATVVAFVGHALIKRRQSSPTTLPFAPALTVGALVVAWSAA